MCMSIGEKAFYWQHEKVKALHDIRDIEIDDTLEHTGILT